MLGFDGRKANFPLPIVDGKYPEGVALDKLLTVYVSNARAAPPAPRGPVATNADSISRMVRRPLLDVKNAALLGRDNLLRITDRTQLPDAPLTAQVRRSWANYRQALRDLPTQPGFPANVVWPIPPSQIIGPAGRVLADARGVPLAVSMNAPPVEPVNPVKIDYARNEDRKRRHLLKQAQNGR